jgi:hypothetical protein
MTTFAAILWENLEHHAYGSGQLSVFSTEPESRGQRFRTYDDTVKAVKLQLKEQNNDFHKQGLYSKIHILTIPKIQ